MNILHYLTLIAERPPYVGENLHKNIVAEILSIFLLRSISFSNSL
jgi:hypothetical protein